MHISTYDRSADTADQFRAGSSGRTWSCEVKLGGEFCLFGPSDMMGPDVNTCPDPEPEPEPDQEPDQEPEPLNHSSITWKRGQVVSERVRSTGGRALPNKVEFSLKKSI